MGCEKLLSEKYDQQSVVPSSLKHLQALLDNEQVMNQRSPRAGEMSADDYYLPDVNWTALNDFDKRMYTWDKHDVFPEGSASDWGYAYAHVYWANVVLSEMNTMGRVPGDEDEWNNVMGQALFTRGQAFLRIASIWAMAYDEHTARIDPGIPLRLDPDYNIRTTRATVEQTYDQIISDLKKAAELLPQMPLHMLRPSKAGAYALLARTYLSMRKYTEMGYYANLCLQIKHTLRDFNSLKKIPPASFPFAPRFSNEDEIITESCMMAAPALHFTAARIDSGLYTSFSINDLRREVFFRINNDSTHSFRGNYTGSATLFSGIATNEVYLMRAESYARAGSVSNAMADLNHLLEKRFTTGTFAPHIVNNPEAALLLILMERRKELIMQGLRWIDVKRLNKEGRNITLKRIVNGRTYILSPNDPGVALPIPEDVIRNAGIAQN